MRRGLRRGFTEWESGGIQLESAGQFGVFVQPFPVPTTGIAVSDCLRLRATLERRRPEIYFLPRDGRILAAQITDLGSDQQAELFPGLDPGPGLQPSVRHHEQRTPFDQRLGCAPNPPPITLIKNAAVSRAKLSYC